MKEVRLVMKISVMFALACCLALGCHKDIPVDNPVSGGSGCTMTGRWRVTIDGDEAYPVYWDLYDNKGDVTGDQHFTFTSATGKFYCYGSTIGSLWFYDGTMNASCNEFEGTYLWENKGGGGVIDSWSFKGVRL
jgi:hypothetical protein